MKAVIDTNVIVSGLISANSPPGQILRAWRRNAFELVTSSSLLSELERVLPRAKIASRLRWSSGRLASFMEELRQNTKVVNPLHELEAVAADADDNRVLEAAIEGKVDFIVSGDCHVIDLGEYEGIQIVTPARFIALLSLEPT